jgi:hypothetical protein
VVDLDKLRAAMDETERVARAAGATWTMEGERDELLLDFGGHTTSDIGFYEDDALRPAEARHIALHDPERELRTIAAHRKILALWDDNERELEANSAEFSRPARPMEDDAQRFRHLGNAKAQGWELQGRRWALRAMLTALAEAYGVEA